MKKMNNILFLKVVYLLLIISDLTHRIDTKNITSDKVFVIIFFIQLNFFSKYKYSFSNELY